MAITFQPLITVVQLITKQKIYSRKAMKFYHEYQKYTTVRLKHAASSIQSCAFFHSMKCLFSK